jgi:hypothetical protein
MTQRAQSFLATVDISGKIQANTAPTTALAIIQEAIIPTTALFKRILSSLSRELQVIYRINKRTYSKAKYQEILADPQADPMVDFNVFNLDIVPTANAEMSSKMHRIQTAQLQMDQLPNVLQAGGNPSAILKDYFDAIGSQLMDQVFPEENNMTEQDRQIKNNMMQAQQQQAAAAKQTAEMLAREQDRLDAETRLKMQGIQGDQAKVQADMQLTAAQAEKARADAQATLIKSQSANAIDPYAARQQDLDHSLQVHRQQQLDKITSNIHMKDLEIKQMELQKTALEAELVREKVNSERVSQGIAVDKAEHSKQIIQQTADTTTQVKLEKAKKLATVNIISEEEFLKMISE